MKPFFRGLLILLLVVLVNSVIVRRVHADQVIFSDDFEAGLGKWQPTRDDGSAWHIWNGMAGATVNYPFKITELIPKDEFWNNSYKNIQVDFDMYALQGVDKNFTMSFNSISDFYEFHYYGGAFVLERTVPSFSQSFTANLGNNTNYHFKILYSTKKIQTYINNQLYADAVDDSNQNIFGKIGMKVGTGNTYPSEVYFDNIVVTGIDPESTPTASPTASPTPVPTATSTPAPTPTPSPSPSPTATPSPVPSPTPEPTVSPTASPSPSVFPYFSQRDPLWSSDIYDSAKTWSPTNPSFGSYGCAVTSTAMILSYYGISTLPNGVGTTPGNLNAWLKSVPNGYVGNGLLNWEKISYATQLMHMTHPFWVKLEFSVGSDSLTDLRTELTSGKPTVLQVLPGHFVTAYQVGTADKIDIADPYYSQRTSLADYSNSFVSMRKFTPSFTDLSHILVYVDDSVDVSLAQRVGKSLNSTSSTIFHESVWSQPGNVPSGPTMKVVDLPKPTDGTYRVTLSRKVPGKTTYRILMYDKDGRETTSSKKVLLGDTPRIVEIDYHKTASSGGIRVHDKVSFEIIKSYSHWFNFFWSRWAHANARQIAKEFPGFLHAHKGQFDKETYELIEADLRNLAE